MNITLDTIFQASTHGERYVTSDFGRLTGQGPKVKRNLANAVKDGKVVRCGQYWRVTHTLEALEADQHLRERSQVALAVELGTLIEMSNGGLTGWSQAELLLQMAAIEVAIDQVASP